MSRISYETSSRWARSSLASVAERVFSGVASHRRRAVGSGSLVAVINVGDLREGRVVPLDELSGSPIPADARTDRCRVQVDDLVLTGRGSVLKIALATSSVAGAAISSNLIAIRLGEELLAPVLFAYLQSRRGQAALMGRSRSSTISLALSAKSVGRLRVPVPPMETQLQIAGLVRAAGDNYAAAIGAAEQRRAVAQVVANNMLMGLTGSEASGQDINATGDDPCTR